MSVLDRFSLPGKVVIVTGAASGIGLASANALRDAGATVIGADLQSGDGVASLDVRDSAAVDALVATTIAEHGRLDGYANIAGIAHLSSVVDTTDDELERVMAVNLKGVYWGCRAAARAMIDTGTAGSIVNVASAAAYMGAPMLSCYAIAKAGVVTLTRTLAQEVGRNQIRVNAIAPGIIVTPMTMGLVDPNDTAAIEERRARYARNTKLGRPGEADDIANAVLYLMSEASSFMTGQVLHPNGGAIMAS
jgi:NAD(P)-dependent dehydrogenase (short-subunit alcohol dehydrogenase family)